MITTINIIIPLKNFFKICIITITTTMGIFLITTFDLKILNNYNTQTTLKHTPLKIYINNSNHTKPITNTQQYKKLYLNSEHEKYYNFKTKKYKQNIQHYLYNTTLHLYNKHYYTSIQHLNTIQKNSDYVLYYKCSQINHNQLTYLLQQSSKYKTYKIHIIHKSLQLLSKIQTIIIHVKKNLKKYIIFIKINIISTLKKLQYFISTLEIKYIKTIKNYFSKLIKSNINNHQQLSQLYIILPEKLYYQTDKKPKILQIATHIENTPLMKNYILPKSIQNQCNINYQLTLVLNQQTEHIKKITSQHQIITTHILQVNHIFNKLIEQTQWLDTSTVLKEILRTQISKLPNTPNFQQLNNNIKKLQKKRYQCEYQIKKLPLIILQSTQDNGAPLTLPQQYFLKKQINIQNDLIISLLNSYDIQILELIKLKVSYEKLNNALQKIKKEMHRYLFWVIDIYPITLSYPINLYQDIHRIFTEKKIKQQILSTLKKIFYNKQIIILIIFSTITSIGIYISTNQYYSKFLENSNKCIGKVNQDNFSITFRNIWYSMIISLPIPIFWLTIGYVLNHAWGCPIVISIGNGMNSTAFILWISIVCSYFASPNGLFIIHFGWPKKRIQQVFSHHYAISISTIITLILTLIIFNNYNEQEFYPTLGRLCFILLCIYLTYITNNLKHSKLPLYINTHDSSNNIINRSLWNIIICAPIIAGVACAFGYFFVAQTLLIKLEESLFIWIVLLIIYHLIRRWISIQRRRIALEHAKQKRAQKLAFRIHNEKNYTKHQLYFSNNKQKLESNKNNKKFLDLDAINTQSLQLIRSIITLTAILLMTLLWSELHPAFSFLEKITLWDVTSTIKGVNNIQPITLNSFLIAVVVIIITTKTVHNLPAFLELTLLQHLNLNPGTGYAITTLTKYILMLLGSIIGFSLIGIEWSKIQWLIAALGVGLGFGLQEIFANFISGLMILFEKPIRIGDTITIRNFTGNVTQINTRATTITDWDHKEIIIPNKEFITKKFINWSLSDTITRVVLKIPGPIQKNAKETTAILLQIAKNSTLALNTPPPEVYLSDLQQGFPIFEIRMYVSDTKLRMPLCHQVHVSITEYYQNNGIELPYLPNYIHKNQLTITNEKFPLY